MNIRSKGTMFFLPWLCSVLLQCVLLQSSFSDTSASEESGSTILAEFRRVENLIMNYFPDKESSVETTKSSFQSPFSEEELSQPQSYLASVGNLLPWDADATDRVSSPMPYRVDAMVESKFVPSAFDNRKEGDFYRPVIETLVQKLDYPSTNVRGESIDGGEACDEETSLSSSALNIFINDIVFMQPFDDSVSSSMNFRGAAATFEGYLLSPLEEWDKTPTVLVSGDMAEQTFPPDDNMESNFRSTFLVGNDYTQKGSVILLLEQNEMPASSVQFSSNLPSSTFYRGVPEVMLDSSDKKQIFNGAGGIIISDVIWSSFAWPHISFSTDMDSNDWTVNLPSSSIVLRNDHSVQTFSELINLPQQVIDLESKPSNILHDVSRTKAVPGDDNLAIPLPSIIATGMEYIVHDKLLWSDTSAEFGFDTLTTKVLSISTSSPNLVSNPVDRTLYGSRDLKFAVEDLISLGVSISLGGMLASYITKEKESSTPQTDEEITLIPLQSSWLFSSEDSISFRENLIEARSLSRTATAVSEFMRDAYFTDTAVASLGSLSFPTRWSPAASYLLADLAMSDSLEKSWPQNDTERDIVVWKTVADTSQSDLSQTFSDSITADTALPAILDDHMWVSSSTILMPSPVQTQTYPHFSASFQDGLFRNFLSSMAIESRQDGEGETTAAFNVIEASYLTFHSTSLEDFKLPTTSHLLVGTSPADTELSHTSNEEADVTIASASPVTIHHSLTFVLTSSQSSAESLSGQPQETARRAVDVVLVSVCAVTLLGGVLLMAGTLLWMLCSRHAAPPGVMHLRRVRQITPAHVDRRPSGDSYIVGEDDIGFQC